MHLPSQLLMIFLKLQIILFKKIRKVVHLPNNHYRARFPSWWQLKIETTIQLKSLIRTKIRQNSLNVKIERYRKTWRKRYSPMMKKERMEETMQTRTSRMMMMRLRPGKSLKKKTCTRTWALKKH